MTNPRRPDDVRLSTADLAAAGDRAAEGAADADAVQRPAPAPQNPARPPADREVTHAHHTDAAADAVAGRPATDAVPPALFGGNEAEQLRQRWSEIQTGFVDEPRQAVERADALVASAIKRLAEVFAQERATLEHQWSRGGDVSTEDLRVALRRYRGFFDRLLSM